MTLEGIDALDKFIINCLQQDARRTSASDIAAEADVSPSTVRKRIDRLEELDIIRGYNVDVDYHKAGFQLYALIVCTAPIAERGRLAEDALEIAGVVAVRETMDGAENVHVEAVGADSDDLNRISQELNQLGLDIDDEVLIRDEYFHPYHRFADVEDL